VAPFHPFSFTLHEEFPSPFFRPCHRCLPVSHISSDPPGVPSAPIDNAHVIPPQITAVPPTDPSSLLRKRPARTPGLVGTNAAFLVPDNIHKKFMDGWITHVPLTYLTDKGCLLKNRSLLNSSQDILSYDPATGQVVTTSRTLSDNGELDLTFDEWHQAWRRLLELIKTFLPQEFLMWEIHYQFILNSENRSEMWPLYLAYDAEIRRRATQTSIDPSVFSIGIWNDLEARYTTKKVYSMIQADLKQHPDRFTTPHLTNPHPNTPRNNTSFRNPQHSLPDNPKLGRCIFCGDRSKTHPSHACMASRYSNGSPCYLSRQEPTGTRVNKSGKRFCFSWNGLSGCDKAPCRKGEHSCTLCGSSTHNAQQCDATP
jgi:hypothetical protein